jgi:hypothetical protein
MMPGSSIVFLTCGALDLFSAGPEDQWRVVHAELVAESQQDAG